MYVAYTYYFLLVFIYFNFNHISLLIFYTISYDLQVKVPSQYLM